MAVADPFAALSGEIDARRLIVSYPTPKGCGHFAEPTASASGRLTNAWDISRLDPAGYRYRLRGCLVTSTVLPRQGFVPGTSYYSLFKEPVTVPLQKAVYRRDDTRKAVRRAMGGFLPGLKRPGFRRDEREELFL